MRLLAVTRRDCYFAIGVPGRIIDAMSTGFFTRPSCRQILAQNCRSDTLIAIEGCGGEGSL